MNEAALNADRDAASQQGRLGGMLQPWISGERSWAILIAFITFAALAIRLVAGLAQAPDGGADLNIYYYFSHILLEGGNPYTAPENGPIWGGYGDFPVLEMATYAGLLWVDDSKDTLRVFFILFDVAVIPLIALYAPRPRSWRLAVAVFYAFCPMIIVWWTEVPEDKTILLFFIFLIVFSLERSAMAVAWAATTLLAVYKWISGFFLVPFAMYMWSRMARRAFLIALGLFVLAFALGHVPFFPDNLVAYSRREVASHIYPPGHAAWTQIFDELGIYKDTYVQLFIYSGLAAVYALFAVRRIDIREAVVLSLFFAYVALPNQDMSRALLIALPFLLLIRLTPWRYAALWMAGIMGGACVHFNVTASPALTPGSIRYDVAQWLFSDYASLQHGLWVNLPLGLLSGLYLFDKCTGRYPRRERLLFDARVLERILGRLYRFRFRST